MGTVKGVDLMADVYDEGVYDTAVYDATGLTYTSRYKWILMIDWGGIETDESERLLGVSVDRGQGKYTNGSGDGLADARAGQLSVILNNEDRRFDPRNSGSALYPNVTNLTPIRLLINNTSDWSQEPIFAGTVDDIRPDSSSKTVTITATDDMELLRQQTATTPLKFNTTADAAIRSIAEAVGIDGGNYQASTHPLTVFAVENTNALQVITDLAEASLGQVFVDRRGHLRYYSLSYTGMATHSLNEDDVDKSILQSQPWDERYPAVAVYANRWARTSSKVLWDYGKNLAIPSGSSITVRAEWSNIGSIGALVYSKTPYISSPGVMTNALSAYISNVTPKSCDITVTNVSPWAQATKLTLKGQEYITGLIFSDRRYQPGQKISGTLATEASTKELFTAEDTALPAKRRNKFVLDSQYCQDGNYAQAYATLLKNHLKSGLSTVTVTFESAASFAQQFGMELYDLVELDAPTLGIAGDDYYLGAIRHEWQAPEVGKVQTTMTLVQLLKSSVSITPEPIIDIPEEITDPPDSGTLPPDTGGGTDCLSDAPANGPFDLLAHGPNMLYNYDLNRVGTYSLPCTIRNNVHANRTIVEIAYKTESTTDGGFTWHADAQSLINIRAVGSGGDAVATASDIGGGRWRFEIPINVKAAAIIVEVPAGGGGAYTLGDTIASGTMDATNDAGIALPVTVGQYYSIEATGGPWYTPYPQGAYEFGLMVGGSPAGIIGHNPYIGYVNTLWSPAFASYNVDGSRGRIYFEATSTDVLFVLPDPDFSDNTGSLGYLFKSLITSGNSRVTITSLTIRNICPA
jgi:hypothetical protein